LKCKNAFHVRRVHTRIMLYLTCTLLKAATLRSNSTTSVCCETVKGRPNWKFNRKCRPI